MDLARNLKVESVSRLHPSPPRHVLSTQSVADAIAVMRQEAVGCLLVCDGEKVVGIFTERDLMCRVLGPGKDLQTCVAEVMTADPVVVQSKETIGTAIRRMEEGSFRHLPVIDEKGRPVGILSVKRIVHYLVEHFPATVYNLPPNPGAIQQEREGA